MSSTIRHLTFIALFASLSITQSVADNVTVDADSVVNYVLSCRKPNGAFGPFDQEYTDAAWNYPAVYALEFLGEEIENPAAVLKNGLGYPAGHGAYGHWLFFHQRMIRKLLGDADALKGKKIELVHRGYKLMFYGSPFELDNKKMYSDDKKMYRASEKLQADLITRMPQLYYYNLSSLYYLLAATDASGMQVTNSNELLAFIRQQQAPGGGFVDVRVEGGTPNDAEVHIAHTMHALASIKLLGGDVPNPQSCERFIHSCQLPSGAFLFCNDEQRPGNYPDVYYTWAALRALKALDLRPNKIDGCIDWINSLQNADGGFGDQPGWRSRLYSTYYAINALAMTCEDARSGIQSKQLVKPKIESIADGEFSIYQGLHKMPVCTVDELDELRSRKFNLLALKSGRFEHAKPLLEAIRSTDAPMDVILCPEAYQHRTRRYGGLTLNHVANITLDPSWTKDERSKWHAANQLGPNQLPWKEYQQKVIGPVQQLGSLVYPEHDFEMEYAYSAYDDGVHGKSGYNAVLAGFNWQPHDFVRVFPWRERYVDKLTPIADADAHGDLTKWSSQLDHTRHLYLAKGPSYTDFLEAASNGRVICVVYGAEGVPSGITYYGRKAAIDYVRKHVDKWKW